MAERIGKAVLVIEVDNKQYTLAMDQVGKGLDKAKEKAGVFGTALKAATFVAAAAAIKNALTSIVGGLVEVTQRGAEVAAVQGSFTSLTSAIGETNAAMLDAARSGTKGLITDFDLMAAGNKAMLLGLPVTSESFGTMATAATILGRAMKQDAGKSFDDLITALGRGSPLILDNLGLTVKVSEANEAYARILKKPVAELTEAEKKTAFYNAAMDAARKKVAELGGVHLSLTDHVRIAAVTWQNFIDKLGVGINMSPVLQAGMAAIGQAIQTAFGTGSQGNVSGLVRFLEKAAIWATYVGQAAVTAGTVFVTAWYAVKTVVLGVITAIAGVVTANVAFISGVAELGTKIPLIGDKVKGFAAGASALSSAMKDVTLGMAAQTAEAAKGVVGNSDLHRTLDTLGGTLALARDRMNEMKGAAAEAGPAVTKALTPPPDVVTRTAEAAKAIADTMLKLQNDVALGTKAGLDKRLAEIDIAHAAELLKIQELKGATAIERAEMVRLAGESAQQQKNLALAAGDETKAKLIAIQQEISLATMTADDARIAQIEFNRLRELAGLETLKITSLAQYDAMALAINQKYALMTSVAQGSYASVTLAANAAGIETQAQLQKTADEAVRLYGEMKASGEFTAKAVKEQWEKAEEAKRKAKGQTTQYSMSQDQALLQGAGQLFGVLGERFKAAAIAGAIIATYSAVAKALASAPWPASLVLAAGALAAGLANVAKIRSSNAGFAEGTPDLDFTNFGRMSIQPLHGREAVIPQGKGHLLGGEVADELGRRGMGGPGDRLLRRIVDAIEAQPQVMARAVRDALLQAQ